MSPSRFKIMLAKTNEEREKVYRFRYKVYVEEMKRPTHADHQRKIVTDEFDNFKSSLFYASFLDEVIGTARVNFKRDGHIEFEKEYQLERFAPFYDYITTTSKFMIDSRFRRGFLTLQFVTEIYEFGKKNDVMLDFINVNPPLDKFYEHIGYRKYKEEFIHPEYGSVIPMIMVLDDVVHLEHVRSPLARIAAKYRHYPDDILNFLKREGILS
ncbi:MAG: GNAT family N-acyltransferase [Candidatus Pacearchaeota archaeon]